MTMTMTVPSINSAPKFPNWTAAAAAMRRGDNELDVLCALFGIADGNAEDRQAGVLNELSAQRAPGISIYDRQYTAHVYPEQDVSDGQVYEALRDFAAQRATPDPAMVEIRCKSMLALLDKWSEQGPPSAEDEAFWREFDADLAKARRGGFSPAAEEAQARIAELERELAAERARADALAQALRSAEGVG